MLVHQYSFFHHRNYYLIIRCSTTMHIYTSSFIYNNDFETMLYINGLSYGSHVVRPYAGSLIPPHASYYSRRPVLTSYLSNKYATGNSDCRGSSSIPIFVIFCVYQTVNPLDHIHGIRVCYWDTSLRGA